MRSSTGAWLDPLSQPRRGSGAASPSDRHLRWFARIAGPWPSGRVSLSQPRQTFSGADLYPTLTEKAAVLCFSLIKNHPFVDGNKRIGHAAMEVMLMLNGYQLTASTEAAEATVLAVASGALGRQAWTDWARQQTNTLE